MDIGKNIASFRKLNGLKQVDLANKLEVTDKAVSSWERGRTEPSIGMIEKMCEIFHCKKSDIIDGPVISDVHMIISPEEIRVLSSYRRADEGTKTAVCKLLDIERLMFYAKKIEEKKGVRDER